MYSVQIRSGGETIKFHLNIFSMKNVITKSFSFRMTTTQEQFLYHTITVEAENLVDAVGIAHSKPMINWEYQGDDNGVTLDEVLEHIDIDGKITDV